MQLKISLGVQRLPQHVQHPGQRDLGLSRAYLEDGDDDGAENGEPVHTVQSVPHAVVLLEGHPAGSDEEIEDEVHE